MGLVVAAYQGGTPRADQVLVVGPGGDATLAAHGEAVRQWVKASGHVFGIGLGQQEAGAFNGERSRRLPCVSRRRAWDSSQRRAVESPILVTEPVKNHCVAVAGAFDRVAKCISSAGAPS
jgi:carbamoylphosphate synthase small subunit